MKTYKHTAIIHVKTAPYENIAKFGVSVCHFQHVHPGVDLFWEEAEYADEDAEDGDGEALVADDVEIFEKDGDWATFLVRFKRKADRDYYEAWRAGKIAGSPLARMREQLNPPQAI